MNKKKFSHHTLLKDTKITDSFWSAVQNKVCDNVIPYQYDALNDNVPDAEKSYCIENFNKCFKR